MKRKKAVCILAAVFLLFSVMCFSACGEEEKRASEYTLEEHLSRVSKRVKKKYMTEKHNFTSYAVYPLYGDDEKVKYILVEFEPDYFMYVRIQNNHYFMGYACGYGIGGALRPWSKYTIDPTNSQPEPETDICYERDDNGEIVEYEKSPYAVAGISEEKRYLLSVKDLDEEDCFIPAVKTEEGFVNLLSDSLVVMEDGCLTEKQATTFIKFYAGNNL